MVGRSRKLERKRNKSLLEIDIPTEKQMRAWRAMLEEAVLFESSNVDFSKLYLAGDE